RIANFLVLGSAISPIAIPATGLLICIPASIRAKHPAQTVAIDDEPFDSKISETIRMVYGLSCGITAFNALKARLPWPISRRPVPRIIFTSPVEKGGKL